MREWTTGVGVASVRRDSGEGLIMNKTKNRLVQGRTRFYSGGGETVRGHGWRRGVEAPGPVTTPILGTVDDSQHDRQFAAFCRRSRCSADDRPFLCAK